MAVAPSDRGTSKFLVIVNIEFVHFKLTVCGIEELTGHCDVGVSHVLSILDPGYPSPPAFGSFGEHERLELRFNDVIEDIEGCVPPQPADVERLLAFGQDLMHESATGTHLLVHCHAGISRSTAAMTLILAQARPDDLRRMRLPKSCGSGRELGQTCAYLSWATCCSTAVVRSSLPHAPIIGR